jgi:hypothetical protein
MIDQDCEEAHCFNLDQRPVLYTITHSGHCRRLDGAGLAIDQAPRLTPGNNR